MDKIKPGQVFTTQSEKTERLNAIVVSKDKMLMDRETLQNRVRMLKLLRQEWHRSWPYDLSYISRALKATEERIHELELELDIAEQWIAEVNSWVVTADLSAEPGSDSAPTIEI